MKVEEIVKRIKGVESVLREAKIDWKLIDNPNEYYINISPILTHEHEEVVKQLNEELGKITKAILELPIRELPELIRLIKIEFDIPDAIPVKVIYFNFLEFDDQVIKFIPSDDRDYLIDMLSEVVIENRYERTQIGEVLKEVVIRRLKPDFPILKVNEMDVLTSYKLNKLISK